MRELKFLVSLLSNTCKREVSKLLESTYPFKAVLCGLASYLVCPFQLQATYAEDLSTECHTCPAGYQCPENKRKELCPFDSVQGFFYSTDASKLELDIIYMDVLISGAAFLLIGVFWHTPPLPPCGSW